MPAYNSGREEYRNFADDSNYVKNQLREEREDLADTVKALALGAAVGALAYTAFQNAKRAGQVGGTTKVQMRR